MSFQLSVSSWASSSPGYSVDRNPSRSSRVISATPSGRSFSARPLSRKMTKCATCTRAVATKTSFDGSSRPFAVQSAVVRPA
eukprot:6184547-Pleurochrysis_carterae.AAC.1